MSSTYGENIKITVFGQSHSPGIGVTIEGIPAGSVIDVDELVAFLKRRAPGNNEYSTARKERDLPQFICGAIGDVFCGAPVTAIIRNSDVRQTDYDSLNITPRPGHADYTAAVKYRGFQDYAGGGHFSGRLTAPICVAGGVCIQLLKQQGIEIISRIASIGNIKDEGALTESTAAKPFPTVSEEAGEKMIALIAEKKKEGDSVGGVIECVVNGLPAGLGDPMFDGMENRIASIVFGIPAVKGIEFGDGFAAAEATGSENNDEFIYENGEVRTKTNHCGGILGGITNGMPLVFRAAIKPTPSIAKEQNTINLVDKKETTLNITGRHDPCIVPRAVPVIEAAAAIAIYDAVLSRKKEM